MLSFWGWQTKKTNEFANLLHGRSGALEKNVDAITLASGHYYVSCWIISARVRANLTSFGWKSAPGKRCRKHTQHEIQECAYTRTSWLPNATRRHFLKNRFKHRRPRDVYFFRLTLNMRQGLTILGPWKIATSDNQRTFKNIRMADEQ